jgi:hypothetical protein
VFRQRLAAIWIARVAGIIIGDTQSAVYIRPDDTFIKTGLGGFTGAFVD